MDLQIYFKNVLGMLKLDSKAFKYVDKKVSWKDALILITLLSIIEGVLVIGAYGFGSIIGTPLVIFLFGGLLFLFLKLFGGKGDYLGTIKFISSIGMVSVLFSVIMIVIQRTFSLPVDDLLTSELLPFIVGVWVFVTLIYAQSYLHKISKLRTFFAMFLPLTILFLFMILVIVVFFAGVLSTVPLI